jgi:carbamoyltransferase
MVDGKVVAAAHEERFTRKKHDENFPVNAVRFCLDWAKLKPKDLAAVAFYDKPFLKFERILVSSLDVWPEGVRAFVPAMRTWLTKKLWLKSILAEEMEGYGGEFYFPQHHMSHAASAFLVSPFDRAAILTMDGVGEWETATRGFGEGTKITLTDKIDYPDSLGLLYSAFTYYLGFKVNSAEYKVMGLAPYGKPRYVKKIKDNIIDIKPDGSFKMNMNYFAYPYALRMTNENFDDLFGAPARLLGFKPTQTEMDLAASIQAVTDEIMVKAAKTLAREYKTDKLCMAGGVALNCVANGKILTETPIRHLFIQPAAGDAGGAVGAAAYVYYTVISNQSSVNRNRKHWVWETCFLGPEYSNQEINKLLKRYRVKYQTLPVNKLLNKVADLIIDQQVVGWFQGRMEYGPRALGNRSILADARNPENQKRVNLKIKFRESFRPFAPVVLEDKAKDWFDLYWTDPYMLTVCPVRNKQIPAVTHVDKSARLQTISRKQNPVYYDLIKLFGKKTGVPVLINTSYNQRGEPIVCTPEDALMSFLGTDIDYLVFNHRFLLDKRDMPVKLISKARSRKFEPD